MSFAHYEATCRTECQIPDLPIKCEGILFRNMSTINILEVMKTTPPFKYLAFLDCEDRCEEGTCLCKGGRVVSKSIYAQQLVPNLVGLHSEPDVGVMGVLDIPRSIASLFRTA